VQKVRAAVAWCRRVGGPQAKIAVAGYGEGGLVSLYAAALETQIDAVLVSGYWGPREDIWREPLYRNVWGLLDEFGDAEIATLIAPRKLLIEYSQGPVWKRNVPHTGPGELRTPGYKSVKDELERAEAMLKPGFGDRRLICGPESSLIKFGSQAAFQQLATALGIRSSMSLSKRLPEETRRNFDPNERQGRAVKQMENHTQLILRNSEYRRDMSIWPRLAFDSVSSYEQSAESLRYEFQYDHIGWLNNPLLRDMNPRSRKIYDTEKWIGYDVVLDVWPDVFAWGILCVPKNIGLGERRPVVVCQHGLEGVPSGVVEAEGFAARLAEQGFITFAPHNLYRGGDEFRLFQRKSNPLKASLFSIITPQHSQIINWLETLPFVDRDRIAFYGISYGGKSAMRIPAMERRYMLSICSADFNEWVRVNADIHFPKAYMYRGPEYEMPEWDLGHSFNYAEMTYLIAPRPFMVERGRRDKVGIDSWVAYEFARARRVYDALAIPDRCVIEYFDGPHQIHGVGTFDFLHHFLSWPQ
jgi:dienelactone hydrolase